MSLSSLISSLENHGEKFPEEKVYADSMVSFLSQKREKAFHNFHWDDGHFTASMLVTNPEFTRVLLIFHKKLQKWLQFGGHSDDSPNILATAIRECHEESGIIEEPEIFSYHGDQFLPIFDLDIHSIPPDAKGRPEHKHYDIRFLGIVRDTVVLSRQLDETEDIRWFNITEVEKYIEEDGLLRMIEKIKKLAWKPSIS
jgi:8-oxo-dGTP pyrophosphatase MutT (NUDIX family)